MASNKLKQEVQNALAAQNGAAQPPEPEYSIPPTIDPEHAIQALVKQVEDVERRAAGKLPFFEEAAAVGESAVASIDLRRFLLGRLCNALTRSYGSADVLKFAKRCGIADVTARQYGGLVTFYGWDTLVTYVGHSCIRYDHLRTAKAAGSTEKAVAFLEMAAAQQWTVDELALHVYGKPALTAGEDGDVPGEREAKLMDLRDSPVVELDHVEGTVKFFVGEFSTHLQHIGRVHLIVKIPESMLESTNSD